jgi:hypothetical protein
LEFHVDANGVGQAAGEQADLLLRRQVSSMRHFCQERILVLGDGTPEWQTRQIGEMVDSHGRPKPLLAESFERFPWNFPGVTLQHEIPVLCRPGHVE